MELALFKPDVQCGTPITASEVSCAYIINDMFKNHKVEKFGVYSVHAPNVDVALPLVLKSRKMQPASERVSSSKYQR